MTKRELEEHILKLAEPLLYKLYGRFSVDPTHTDRPDVAITVHEPRKRFGRNVGAFKVGVEVTTVDRAQDLAYLNDKKYGRDKIIAQTRNALENGIDSNRPIKKAEIRIDKSYIYDGAIKKEGKYCEYMNAGDYREIILLCFSDVIATNTNIFREHLRDHTNYLLSKSQFPFDAVLFASLQGGDPVRIYKRTEPLLTPPKSSPHQHQEHVETIIHGPTMRVGQTYKLEEIFSNNPIITPRQARSTP